MTHIIYFSNKKLKFVMPSFFYYDGMYSIVKNYIYSSHFFEVKKLLLLSIINLHSVVFIKSTVLNITKISQ